MNTEKNISVTLKQSNENDNDAVLSLSSLVTQIKKYFMIWVVISAIAAMFISGLSLLFKTNVSDNKITALVNFSYNGIQSGLAPDGTTLDVNKIKSPSVIETALSSLDMSLNNVESIRRNIFINGVIPNDAMDKISLYQSVYSKGGSSALTAVESLLNIGYYPTYYVITLDYSQTGFDLTTSKQVLDRILRSYQKYFFTTYGYNEALGNSVVAVDYKDYDYPVAIDVFNSMLTNLNDYLSRISSENSDFRSNVTGYSFQELITKIDTLKSADIDSLSSYIFINNVTSNKKLLLTFYKYQVEKIESELKIYQSELDSITNSIDNYEKDNWLIFGEGAEQAGTNYSQASEKYDNLIRQKVEKQKVVSRSKQQISYYNDRIDALNQNNTVSTDDNIKYVEEHLASISSRITELIDIVNKTSDEFYETVTFAHAYNILVPATGAEPTVVTKELLIPILIGEVVIFIIYVVIAFTKALIIDYNALKLKRKRETDVEDDQKELIE